MSLINLDSQKNPMVQLSFFSFKSLALTARTIQFDLNKFTSYSEPGKKFKGYSTFVSFDKFDRIETKTSEEGGGVFPE